jgi:23S rRNA (uracil1939-C5)-methyltransferase
VSLKKHYGEVIKNLAVDSVGAEGVCIARWDGKVIFVKYAVPGDIADIKIIGFKKRFLIGEIVAIGRASPQRTKPFCEHFGLCGGCKWQHLFYTEQLKWKQQQVLDAFTRLHKIEVPEISPIIGSPQTTHYRNKLEYTFSENRWVLPSEPENATKLAAGFHIQGRFDKVLDINKCRLQDDLTNDIRLFIKNKSLEMGLTFYNLRTQQGFVRNLIVRNTTIGEWMVILVVGEDNRQAAEELLSALRSSFPQLTSLFYIINTKQNDTIYDLPMEHFYGEVFITEEMDGLKFKIRPKSFFQPNPEQAKNLYQIALNYCGLTGSETVYDLYCGTGTISLFLARNAKKVVGIESVPQAIEDAIDNALFNKIENAFFEVGDMRLVLNQFITQKYGKPDVVVVDPPRTGMHDDVIKQLLLMAPEKIVYVSCNPATQARDTTLLSEMYDVKEVQPVDMFPHTHHVENVILLQKR